MGDAREIARRRWIRHGRRGTARVTTFLDSIVPSAGTWRVACGTSRDSSPCAGSRRVHRVKSCSLAPLGRTRKGLPAASCSDFPDGSRCLSRGDAGGIVCAGAGQPEQHNSTWVPSPRSRVERRADRGGITGTADVGGCPARRGAGSRVVRATSTRGSARRAGRGAPLVFPLPSARLGLRRASFPAGSYGGMRSMATRHPFSSFPYSLSEAASQAPQRVFPTPRPRPQAAA